MPNDTARRKNRESGPKLRPIRWLGLVLGISLISPRPAAWNEEAPDFVLPFRGFSPIRFVAPALSPESIALARDPKSAQTFQLDLADFQARTDKKWTLEPTLWPSDADLPEGATVTLIHSLMENAALVFALPIPASGAFAIDLSCPSAPWLGGMEISLNGKKRGVFDLWAPAPQLSEWHPLAARMELGSGTLEFRVKQTSPSDLPLALKSLRMRPVD